MARALTSGMQTEVVAATLRPVLFVEAEFASGTVRLWSGVGNKTWNGQTWSGAGGFLGASTISESADLRAQGISLSLSGLPSDFIALALAEARLGKPGTVWLGALQDDGTVIADPYLAFKGKLDAPTIENSGDACTISISYENELIDLQRARVRRYTLEDHQIDHPGNPSFEYVAGLQGPTLQW